MCQKEDEFLRRCSVEENIELGAFLRKDKAGIQQDLQKVYEIFPRLL